MARKTRKQRPWFRAIVLFLIVLVLIPILEVLYVRFFNPPVTTLMIVRRVEAMITKRYHGDIQYRWIPLDRVPDNFLDGVWQIEDSRFFSHDGFDWIEMEEAIKRAERRRGPVQGVSTISNQCARSLVLARGKSRGRKRFESFHSFLVGPLLSKQRLPRLYVNVIEL